MRCPKCGYNSFDHYLTCPKCRKDLAAVRRMLNLTVPAPGSVNFFRAASQRLTFPEPILEADSLGASIAPPLAFGAAAMVIPAEELIEDEPVFSVGESVPKPPLEDFAAFEAPADLEPIEDLEPLEDIAPIHALSPVEGPSPFEDISPLGDPPPLESPAPQTDPTPIGEMEVLELTLDDLGELEPLPEAVAALEPEKRPAPEKAPQTDDDFSALVENVNLDDLDGKL